MAVPLVVPNAGFLQLNWSGNTRTWHNVLGLVGAPSLPPFDQTLANSLFTDIRGNANTTAYMAQMATTTILESISIRSINTPNLPLFTSTGTPLAGGGTGDALPLSVAACITLRTALAGRSFRGRTYLTGFTEGANDANGRITSAANLAAQGFIAGIFGLLGAHSLGLAVVSRPAAAITIPAVTIAARTGGVNAVTSALARDQRWESSRRRTGRQ